MCGIAGVLGDRRIEARTLTRMARAIAHRGPDDEGVWLDAEAGIGFAHRRLAILDPSPAGHQPMLSASGRYVLNYNGEIYNHLDLRRELEAAAKAPDWRSGSDTETLLAGFEAWGTEGTFKRASGMFALALWDRSNRTLTLVRDRLGEKPLYYGRPDGIRGAFLFASEFKAMRQYPGFDPDVDRRALAEFLRFNNVPAPLSIYRGISKLPAGSMLTLREDGEPAMTSYWSGADVAADGAADPLALDDERAADELERILEGAIGRQMLSDVPLGAFLSGGVDSSTIVAVMQKLSSKPVKTFTVGFDAGGFDEAPHAGAVARHLGTEHHELTVSAAEARDVIPSLPDMYDEPFADSSQIPTHLISALARRHVTVALSGDGGDELFGGYDRYRFAAGLWPKLARVPRPMRKALGRAATVVPAAAWTRLGDSAASVLPQSLRLRRLGEKVHKGAPMLSNHSLEDLYRQMRTHWPDSETLVIGAPTEQPPRVNPTLSGLGAVERMMAEDMLGYLPDDILVKVDRAAMAVSLETRVPLLDPEVVSFAWRLPLNLKIRGGTTKWLLRQVLYRHVPAQLIERPKTGFTVPLASWLRGPLRDWGEALLDSKMLNEDGYFHPAPIRGAWDSLLRGDDGQQFKLWTVLMFQSWRHAQAPLHQLRTS
jgi:asparagine synthase (glutamine-hydrolysing)